MINRLVVEQLKHLGSLKSVLSHTRFISSLRLECDMVRTFTLYVLLKARCCVAQLSLRKNANCSLAPILPVANLWDATYKTKFKKCIKYYDVNYQYLYFHDVSRPGVF